MYPYPMPGAPPQDGQQKPGANATPGASQADLLKQITKLRADLGRAVQALRRSKLSSDMADLPLMRDLANSLGNLIGSPGNPDIAARVKRQADALAGQTKRTARNKIGGVDIQGAAQHAAALADQIAGAVPTSERVNTAAEAQWLWEILSGLTKSGMLRSKAGSLQKAIEKGDPGTIARIDAELGLLRIDTDAETEVVAAMRSLTAPPSPPADQMGHDYARVAAAEIVHLWQGDTTGFQGLKRGSRLTPTFARAAVRLWTLAQNPDDATARAVAEQVAGELRQASEDNANSGEEQKTARQAARTIDEALNPR